MLRFIVLVCFSTLSFIACKEEKLNSQQNNEVVLSGDTDLDYFSKAISKDGLNPELRFKRAQVLYDREMYPQAIEDLRVAITVDSLQPTYYHLLADVFLDNTNSNKAIQTMKVASSLFPERIPTLLKLSEMHYIVKQYQESISALNSITRYDPQNAEAYFMLGLNFRSMGDNKRALNALQTSTEFDSKLIDAWLVLAEILESEGNSKAEQYLKTALSIEPENVNTLHSLAYYYQNHDDVDKALEMYKKINNIQIDYGDAYLNAGILHLERAEFSEAVEQFEILVSQQPLNPVAHYYKGYTFNQLGNVSGAIASLENAVNLNQEYSKAIELLAELNKK